MQGALAKAWIRCRWEKWKPSKIQGQFCNTVCYKYVELLVIENFI